MSQAEISNTTNPSPRVQPQGFSLAAPVVPGLPAEIAELAARARSYADSAKAANTRKAYNNDWRHFEAWCHARGILAMPADSIGAVLAYLTAHAAIYKVSTLQRRLAQLPLFARQIPFKSNR